MTYKYYIAKRYYVGKEEYVEQYWDGSGFSIYENAAIKYVKVNMASDVAQMLLAISVIQDETNVRYVMYQVSCNKIIRCTEVTQ